MGVLYDTDGLAVFGFASSAVDRVSRLRWGVAEEDFTFVVALDLRTKHGEPVGLRLGSGRPYTTLLRGLAEWLAVRTARPPLPVPAAATRPVYSTWYAYHDALDEKGFRRAQYYRDLRPPAGHCAS